MMHEWLHRHLYLPLARRGHARIGTAAAFTCSAGFHIWFVLIALGPKMAALMGSFFFLQLGAIAVEARLGIRRWPSPAARAWTLTVLTLSSPLFMEPMLVIMG